MYLKLFITSYTAQQHDIGDQNGLYTARYGLKGCHRAVRTVPATQNREKAVLQARPNVKKRQK